MQYNVIVIDSKIFKCTHILISPFLKQLRKVTGNNKMLFMTSVPNTYQDGEVDIFNSNISVQWRNSRQLFWTQK